jgi:hypothetical protein
MVHQFTSVVMLVSIGIGSFLTGRKEEGAVFSGLPILRILFFWVFSSERGLQNPNELRDKSLQPQSVLPMKFLPVSGDKLDIVLMCVVPLLVFVYTYLLTYLFHGAKYYLKS